jgi:hypothetical protein
MTNQYNVPLESQVIESIELNLSKKYFLIPRSAWWAFLGGALAFAVGVGVVSYQSALKGVADPSVRRALDSIFANEKAATAAVAKINQELKESSLIDSRLSKLEAEALRIGAKVRLTQLNTRVIGKPPTMVLTGGSPTTTAPENPSLPEQNWTITRK